jgi:arylsulfatase A-like enzyme
MQRASLVFLFTAVLLSILYGCEKTPAPERSVPSPTTARVASRPAPPPQPQPTPPKKPNVLIVVLDTLRYDASQLDPASRNATPFLASLQKRGVTFTRCYTTEDSTPPAHFSLLTGYGGGWTGPLDVPSASLAHQLGLRGYHSFGVAANPILSPGSYRPVSAFDDYVCLPDVYAALDSSTKAAENAKIDARARAWGNEANEWDRSIIWSSAEKVLSRAMRRLRRSRAPFFGFINFIDAHDPYYPELRFYDRSAEHAKVGRLRFRSLPDELVHPETIADSARRAFVTAKIEQANGRAWSTDLDLEKAQVDVYRKRYLAEVRRLDGAMRHLFEGLAELKLLDSTVVIITSDHGESFGEQHLMTHTFNNRGDLEATNHVPLLILFPPSYGIAPATVSFNVTLADIPPMIYQLVGVDDSALAARTVPANYGHTILPYITQQPTGQVSEPILESWPALKPDVVETENAEARRRLRSLGYIQ